MEVVLVRTNREKREGEQLQKVSRFLLFVFSHCMLLCLGNLFFVVEPCVAGCAVLVL